MTLPVGQHASLYAARAVVTSPVEMMAVFPEFAAASWDAWRRELARLTPDVREFYAIVGRGAGKSRIVALLACAFASRDYPRVSGERIYIGIFAPDRKQAGVTFRYVVGLLRSVPALAALIESETKESVALATGITIEVISASIAAPRGRAYALVIIEEAAFLPQDQSANPDVELLRAVRPALARVSGSLLAVVSSPYARRGVLWAAWQRHQAKPDDAVVVIKTATLALNPTFDARAVERAYEDDPASAAAEYGGEFRADVETFLDSETIAACVAPGRRELPPVAGEYYVAFVDPSGGSVDSMTLAIAHQGFRDGEPIVVVDAVREVRPPFSPESTVRDFAALLRTYGVFSVSGDRYAGEWPREQFAKHGIGYQPSDRPKSDLYRDFLPLANSRRVELPDLPRLRAQLGALERRTARGGRDSIDHAPGGHDDVANAVCGAALGISLHAYGDATGRTLTDEEYVIVRSPKEFFAELERRRLQPSPGDEQRIIRWAGASPAQIEQEYDALVESGDALVWRQPGRGVITDNSRAQCEWDPFDPDRD
jgi:hypothetical protein